MSYDTDGLGQEIKFSGKEPTRSFGGVLLYSEIKEALKKKFPKFNIPKKEWDKDTHGEWDMRLKLERNFQNAHFRAYLRGQKQFVFGRDFKNKKLYFNVEEVWE